MNVLKLNTLRPLVEGTLRRCLVQLPQGNCQRKLLDPRPITFCMQRGRRTLPPPKPMTFDYSGDLERALPEYDLSTTRLEFEDSEELPKASGDIKKILSLEFGTSGDLKERRIDDIIKAVQEHPADIASLEVKIARATIQIRNQIKHAAKFRKDKVSKSMLIERIQGRRKHLKFLRLRDKEKFDWLLKELKIKYVPTPDYDKHQHWMYRKSTKRSRRKSAAVTAFFATRRQKLEKLEADFKAKKKEFEEAKEKEMAVLEKELQEMGIKTNVSNLNELFKEMGLGPPYYIKEEIPKPQRWHRLQKKFEKYAGNTQRNVTALK